ncbi:MAG TPA: YidB family protein [Candidatus Eremiobacteraceae bacterium]|nr:YidB family protein [Candidatus Eremiobacteraceae bacterium]
MGLLDEVLAVAGSSGSGQSEQHTTGLSAIMTYINSPEVGGIAGLQHMFEQGGLGHVVSSWIGSGPNLPVSADQLQNVLHSGALQQAAQQHGLDASQLTGMMSTLLPHLVNHLTPNGQAPDASTLQQMLKGFAAGQST